MALFSKVLNFNSDRKQSSSSPSSSSPQLGSRILSPTLSSRSSSGLTPTCSAASTASSSIVPTKSASSITKKSTRSHSSSASKSGSKSAPKTCPNYTVTFKLESPPIILYGQPSESTGSILSGLLRLVTHAEVKLEKVTLSLIQTMKYTKPFILPNSSAVANCSDCVNRTEVLARWDVLTAPTTFPAANHAYPFSHLLPGSLPPTSKLGSSHSQSFIKYDLIAEVQATDPVNNKTLVLPINVSRSILRGPDRNSLRVFPPTEVTATAVLPNVIHPKSSFPIELTLENMANREQQRRWRMRKLSWRVEENIKIRARACETHGKKLETLEKTFLKIPAKKDKNQGLHHSTVQTNISLLANPSTQVQGTFRANEVGNRGESLADGVDQIVENEMNDMEDTLRSGPQNAQQSFLEDFGDGTHNTNNTYSQQAQGSTAAPLTPQTSAPDPRELAKHLYLEETRTISYGDIKSGWKSDFSGSGKIELVANICANRFSTGSNNHITEVSTDDTTKVGGSDFKNGANISCDIDDPNIGIFVNHTLIMEVVVAEELVHRVESSSNSLHPVSSANTRGATLTNRRRSSSATGLAPVASNGSLHNPHQTQHSQQQQQHHQQQPSSPPPPPQQQQPQQMGSPTGAARVLRMQFKLPVTERSGLGIAWDDEVPPTYEDVRTLSPPNYHDRRDSISNVLPSAPQSAVLHDSVNGTPSVLYGRGDTPVVGSFTPLGSGEGMRSLNGVIDNIQELSL
ncbi:uncharacterized protein LODBEIA_P04380 [Lodderomyces beijingensis]|uniref:LDB19 N-terminal domain-containing protein n=1 Tax=Lodderomyces beijingensis TaxID=1775926 RepID=A0ABP0ZEA4_9ASCO